MPYLDDLYGVNKAKPAATTQPLPDAPLPRLTAPQGYSDSNPESNGAYVPPQSPMTNPHGKPNHLGDWLALADAATRGLDVYSTHKMLENGNHEDVLPDIISHHVPAMTMFSEGMAGGNYLLGKELDKHGHSRLGNILKMVDIGVDAPPAINNLFLPNHNANKGGGLKPFKPNR